MTLKLVNRGEGLALEYLINKSVPQNLVLRLYQNDKIPADTDMVGGYTEADFTGYAAIVLAGTTWVVTDGDPGVAAYPEQDFTSSANQTAQTIYGYYLRRQTGGELVWAERFPNPQIIQNVGDRISVTPRIEAKDTGD